MRRWLKRPEGSNWGDFGEDDQIGRMNLVTPERRLAAIGEVHEGLAFQLGLPLDHPRRQVFAGRNPPVLAPTIAADGRTMYGWMPPGGPTDVVNDDQVLLGLQYSTQWDGLSHYGACFDADGDGVAEQRHALLENLDQPFGMALLGDTFYVGNTDGVVAFPYTPGTTRITAPGRPLTSYPGGGHWTRSLLASRDGQRLYVGVGSLSNIAEHGFEAEEGRACIYELDLRTQHCRIFAAGLRNPVGMAWEPLTGRLWTVVNERDGLGDETPPDYLTSVSDGGFYGWPYCYWGQTVDERVPQDAALVARALTPDYALGGHTASLGLCWMPAGTLPGFDGDGMVIGQHGSWNRSTLSGYRVVFVPFADGRPAGPPRDILWGFLAPDESVSYGRPVGVAIGPDGRSLLVADDVGDVVWRVGAAA